MKRSISIKEQRQKYDLINMFNEGAGIKTARLIKVPN